MLAQSLQEICVQMLQFFAWKCYQRLCDDHSQLNYLKAENCCKVVVIPAIVERLIYLKPDFLRDVSIQKSQLRGARGTRNDSSALFLRCQ